MRKLILAAAASLLAVPAAAQQPPPPKLVVVIAIDQFSTALFDEYRPHFTGGLAALGSGTVFRNGSQTQSGAQLAELLKQGSAGSRSVAVSGKAGSPAGRNFDQSWSWSGSAFETNRPAAALPQIVAKANAAIAAALAEPRAPLEPSALCQPKGHADAGQLGRAAHDAAALANSPELDGDTLALAAGLADEMQLGRRDRPDLLAIDLAATANVTAAYGAESEQTCLQLTELDREIGDFLSLLDSRGIDYAVALTGTGPGPVPMIFWRPGFRGATLNAPVTTADMNSTLAALIELPLAPGSDDGHCLEGTPAFCPQR